MTRQRETFTRAFRAMLDEAQSNAGEVACYLVVLDQCVHQQNYPRKQFFAQCQEFMTSNPGLDRKDWVENLREYVETVLASGGATDDFHMVYAIGGAMIDSAEVSARERARISQMFILADADLAQFTRYYTSDLDTVKIWVEAWFEGQGCTRH